MAGRVVGGEQHVAHLDRVAVAQDAIDLDRRIDEIIGVLEVVLVAALHRRDVVLHDRQLRTELLLQIGEGACVIDMGMAVDHELDVFGLEAELADGLDDHRSRRRHAGVHQDVPFGGREQEDAEPLGPDEVDRADDPAPAPPVPPI